MRKFENFENLGCTINSQPLEQKVMAQLPSSSSEPKVRKNFLNFLSIFYPQKEHLQFLISRKKKWNLNENLKFFKIC